MAQVTKGIRSLLSVPWLYVAWGRLLGGDRARKELVDRIMKVEPGDRVFDIGCGTASLFEKLPEGAKYTGFDVSLEYVEEARQRLGDAATIIHAAVGDSPSVPEGQFDISVANGVLHHLGDDEAECLFELAYRSLRRGGKLVTVDPVYVEGQSRVARWLISRDRGQNVRRPEAYKLIANGCFGNVSTTIRHDRLRIPYTHLIMECTK
ncbi:MAG: class I SAM-dependent methyltransferase [Verrucomicrobiota bacterium]